MNPCLALGSRSEERYTRLARYYDALDWPFEFFRYRRIRMQVVAGLSGCVLDAGVGTGRNLPYYGPGVSSVTGIDLSDEMLVRAQPRVHQARCKVTLKKMDVTKLKFPGGYFDAVVSTFLFCVLPDELQVPALKELIRVTRPGGQIRILEYQFSRVPWRRRWMELIAPYVERLYGARFDRRTEEAINESGVYLASERFVHADIIRLFELVPYQNQSEVIPRMSPEEARRSQIGSALSGGRKSPSDLRGQS